MNTLKYALAGALLTAMSTAAGASTVFYGTSVDSVNQGTCTSPGSTGSGVRNANGCLVERSDPNEALGSPDGVFYSLGFGGDITIGFDGGPFSGASSATVYEVTTNPSGGHFEAVDIYTVLSGVVSATPIGRLLNTAASNSAFIFGDFDALMFVDVTLDEFASTTSFDGFDLDSIRISEVPLPASALLLLAGVGGIGALRRKKA